MKYNKEEANGHAILFAQFIAENHYVLVNKIGKIYYWKNEDGTKTTVQLMQYYEKINVKNK
jgi:hypothetical protein